MQPVYLAVRLQIYKKQAFYYANLKRYKDGLLNFYKIASDCIINCI